MQVVNNQQVSATYSVACDFIHIHTNQLYESLHTDSGEAFTDHDVIKEAVKIFRHAVFMELDMVRCAYLEAISSPKVS